MPRKKKAKAKKTRTRPKPKSSPTTAKLRLDDDTYSIDKKALEGLHLTPKRPTHFFVQSAAMFLVDSGVFTAAQAEVWIETLRILSGENEYTRMVRETQPKERPLTEGDERVMEQALREGIEFDPKRGYIVPEDASSSMSKTAFPPVFKPKKLSKPV